MDVMIICTLHNVNSFITMNMQITNSDFSKNGKFGETNEYFPRKSLVSFAEKTESIDLSTQDCGLLREKMTDTKKSELSRIVMSVNSGPDFLFRVRFLNQPFNREVLLSDVRLPN